MNTNKIGERQSGDLGGRLARTVEKANVTIAVGDDYGIFRSTQALVWGLMNLLARQEEAVAQVKLEFPADVQISGRISPLLPRSGDFAPAALDAIARINPDITRTAPNAGKEIFVRVGPGELKPADLSISVSSDGWSGYVGTNAATVLTESSNPIGPFIGACLGAGEVFKFAREMKSEFGHYADSLWLNGYSLMLGPDRTASPELPERIRLPKSVLVGVGAVGTCLMQTLYATSGIFGTLTTIDGDEEGITEKNLNRYVLFDLRHCEGRHMKASTAEEMFRGTEMNVAAFDQPWEVWRADHADEQFELVLSAVDKNRARHAIQDALPRMILGASTNDLKFQVNAYDVFDTESPCLKCRNKIEVEGVPDTDIIARLKDLPVYEFEAAARTMGVDRTVLRAYVEDPVKNCGTIAGTSLQKFAASTDIGAWTVGFVSFLAGVLLAAEFVKQIVQAETRMTTGRNQFQFQFWRLDNGAANRLTSVPPEDACVCRSELYRSVIAGPAADSALG